MHPPRVERFSISQIQSDPRFLDKSWLLERWTVFYRGVRRPIDVLTVLLPAILLLFLFPFIAIAIKRDSPGPVIYRQQRVGKNGKLFHVFKFRSMYVDAEKDGAQFTIENDPRITRVGNWMRITRIDELPQVINVLRGDMSLIGPRPERPHVVEEMCQDIPEFAMRTTVLPGVTGYAQVHGGYAATKEELIAKLELDLFYIRNASLKMDLGILLETVSVVRKNQGK